MHARARALLKLKPASQDDRLDIEDDDDDEEVKCQEEGGHEESSCPPMKLRRRGRGGGAAVQQVTRSAARRVQGWRCWRVGRAERYRGGGSARAGRRRGALRACNGEARGRLWHALRDKGLLLFGHRLPACTHGQRWIKVPAPANFGHRQCIMCGFTWFPDVFELPFDPRSMHPRIMGTGPAGAQRSTFGSRYRRLQILGIGNA